MFLQRELFSWNPLGNLSHFHYLAALRNCFCDFLCVKSSYVSYVSHVFLDLSNLCIQVKLNDVMSRCAQSYVSTLRARSYRRLSIMTLFHTSIGLANDVTVHPSADQTDTIRLTAPIREKQMDLLIISCSAYIIDSIYFRLYCGT